tara:strand:+ start:513 stop:659 length:147 start_codon:yes stop_codon:yes gene_type:complete
MKVGDLVKRRNNGDWALVIGISKKRMKIMRLECGNHQCVWDWEYEVIG